jgi:hypothetical protein
LLTERSSLLFIQHTLSELAITSPPLYLACSWQNRKSCEVPALWFCGETCAANFVSAWIPRLLFGFVWCCRMLLMFFDITFDDSFFLEIWLATWITTGHYCRHLAHDKSLTKVLFLCHGYRWGSAFKSALSLANLMKLYFRILNPSNDTS